MGNKNMLTMAIYLDPTPGGVGPELHLKEGCSSVEANLYVLDISSFVDAKQKDCVIRGIRPDGSELYRRLFVGSFDTRLQIHLYQSDVKDMAKVAGTYKCNLTLLDTNSHPGRNDYMKHNQVTVLPFTVVVHKKARRD